MSTLKSIHLKVSSLILCLILIPGVTSAIELEPNGVSVTREVEDEATERSSLRD